MISENNIKKERRSSRGDPDQIGGLHPNIPSAADFQTHQTFPRVPAAGELQHWHCGPSIFSPQMETMRASAQELIIWVYCFAMFVVIFGSTVYYAERCPVPAQPSPSPAPASQQRSWQEILDPWPSPFVAQNCPFKACLWWSLFLPGRVLIITAVNDSESGAISASCLLSCLCLDWPVKMRQLATLNIFTLTLNIFTLTLCTNLFISTYVGLLKLQMIYYWSEIKEVCV